MCAHILFSHSLKSTAQGDTTKLLTLTLAVEMLMLFLHSCQKKNVLRVSGYNPISIYRKVLDHKHFTGGSFGIRIAIDFEAVM